MDKIPTWAKVLGAILITAILWGAARFLISFDQLGGSSKFGID